MIMNQYIEKFISAFSTLGLNLESFINNRENPAGDFQEELVQKIQQAKVKNPWFDVENQYFALSSWAEALQEQNLRQWAKQVKITDSAHKKIGIICAGNIPMVGFHDILSVVLCGHRAMVKLSSRDQILIPFFVKFIRDIYPEIGERIEFVENLKGYDAVIATGSNNTARYFESYFEKVPHIIRRNRTSVAVLDGTESREMLQGLAEDIFRYYGLGCRNVTQVYLPLGYDLDLIFNALYPWGEVINHHKYANNYDYHKAVYMMKNIPIIENGFVLMLESDELFSPIACVFYHFYKSEKELEALLSKNKENIQCIVGRDVLPGKAQKPELWDYADGIDTVKWLSEL